MIVSKNAVLAAVLVAVAPVVPLAASAEVIALKAELAASNEVPPNGSTATGAADASFDTDSKAFSATVTYEGLSGPAIGAHIHGPAEQGSNAGIVLRFESASSPTDLSATLTDAQAADLLAGRLYVNIHTELNPGGEIRGNLTR
jgi:hypothetical protein